MSKMKLMRKALDRAASLFIASDTCGLLGAEAFAHCTVASLRSRALEAPEVSDTAKGSPQVATAAGRWVRL